METVQAESHKQLREDEFWRQTSWFADTSRATFLDYKWQLANTTSTPAALGAFLRPLCSEAFLSDVCAGLKLSPMQIRLTPYVLSLIDWRHPVDDPIRRQFIPLGSEFEREHPLCTLDSLSEQRYSPVSGVTRRYPDKALFLPITVCPVYCRFCTRSYAVGGDTAVVNKVDLAPTANSWTAAFDYLASNPEIEDVVVSGGDAFMLSTSSLETIGEKLLRIPHLRRIRIATKGLAVLPMKVLSDDRWRDMLLRLTAKADSEGKHLCLHTHINHPREITSITRDAVRVLIERGVTIRNQSVLIRNVNHRVETLKLLVRRLGFLNIQPYYVYQHDLVPGTADMRTPLSDSILITSELQGWTAGFNTPRVIVDLPEGGGKRDVTAYEYYDSQYGVSIFLSPAVARGRLFRYYDPLSALGVSEQEEWLTPEGPKRILETVLRRSGIR